MFKFLEALVLLTLANYTSGDRFAKQSDSYRELDLSVSQLIELRGFKAVNHYLTTYDGYIINLVQCNNPLLSNETEKSSSGSGENGSKSKNPVLFVPGTSATGAIFAVNSVGAFPEDFSNLDVAGMSSEELEQLLLDDPNSNSLVFTLLNFGYEVWLLNRRGTSPSQGHKDANMQAYYDLDPIGRLNSTFYQQFADQLLDADNSSSRKKRAANYDEESAIDDSELRQNLINTLRSSMKLLESQANAIKFFNPRYWNFSADEQALVDFRIALDCILEKSEASQVDVVGHSLGAAINLMALSSIESLNTKIGKSLNWAASFGAATPARKEAAKNMESYMRYVGPIPVFPTTELKRKLYATLCSTPYTEQGVCAALEDQSLGYGGQQQSRLPGFFSSRYETDSSHTKVTLLQGSRGYLTHYDYMNADQNLLAYNQTEAPRYDPSQITNRGLTFWVGNKDSLVSLSDIERLVSQLKVPYKLHYLNSTDKGEELDWNHNSWHFHKQVAKYNVIPALRTLASPTIE